MRKLLEHQADRIDYVMRQRGIAATVTGGSVLPRWIRFNLQPKLGTDISQITRLDEDLAAALNVQNCRVQRRGAAIEIQIPRDDPRPVRLLPLMKQAYRFKTLKAHQGRAIATLGLDDEGAPLHIRLPSPDVAHILVSGMTGSGKTVLMRSIILSLAITESPDDLRLVLIDPKGSAFPIFNSLPHTMLDVHTTTQQAAKSINTLVGIMEGRGEIQVNDTRAVLVIDELADLLMTHPEAQEPLTRLLQRGRGSGIHVVAATQKPTASVLGSLMTANFPVRLVGKVSSANDARVASGWSGTGAERLEGRGDFIAVAEGKLIRFQAAYITDDEITDAIYQINRGAPILPSGNQSHSLNLTRAL